MLSKITPCLWFDTEAEAAAKFYTGIFPNSRITLVSHYPEGGNGINGKAGGSVLTVEFELEGQRFTALNGGPMFQFTEAISLQVECATQAELDRYWELLTAGGAPEAQQCGWLKDRFGLSWQIVPAGLPKLLTAGTPEQSQRVFQALMGMQRLNIAELEAAFAG